MAIYEPYSLYCMSSVWYDGKCLYINSHENLNVMVSVAIYYRMSLREPFDDTFLETKTITNIDGATKMPWNAMV